MIRRINTKRTGGGGVDAGIQVVFNREVVGVAAKGVDASDWQKQRERERERERGREKKRKKRGKVRESVRNQR